MIRTNDILRIYAHRCRWYWTSIHLLDIMQISFYACSYTSHCIWILSMASNNPVTRGKSFGTSSRESMHWVQNPSIEHQWKVYRKSYRNLVIEIQGGCAAFVSAELCRFLNFRYSEIWCLICSRIRILNIRSNRSKADTRNRCQSRTPRDKTRYLLGF